MLTLDNVQIRARVDQAQAAVNTVEAQLQAGRTELAVPQPTLKISRRHGGDSTRMATDSTRSSF